MAMIFIDGFEKKNKGPDTTYEINNTWDNTIYGKEDKRFKVFKKYSDTKEELTFSIGSQSGMHIITPDISVTVKNNGKESITIVIPGKHDAHKKLDATDKIKDLMDDLPAQYYGKWGDWMKTVEEMYNIIQESKKYYKIDVLRCGDYSTIGIDLTKNEVEFVKKLANLINEERDYECMPTIVLQDIEERDKL